MQNLSFNNCTNNNNGESQMFHYCYVCNTQLNSCKQALLHCSGKRHKKKLQFLESRKSAVGQHQQTANASMRQQNAMPLGHMDHPGQGFYPVVHPFHGMAPILPYPSEAPLLIQQAPAQFYPTLINAHHVDPWLGQIAISPNAAISPMLPYHQMQSVPPMMPPMPKKFVSAYSGGSSTSSPMGLTDVSVNSISSYSGGAHSAVISPSETSSISSETAPVKLYTCRDCDRQFSNRVQLYVHLQNMQHCKASLQTHHKHSEAKKSVGDLSETDSWSSSTSIYFCAVCNVVLNSKSQLEAHNAGQKHKQRSIAQRKQSRSSSASSDPPERVMDSGYVSSSGDEVICVAHPTPDKPTAKFRCQLCNLLLNSPAQAKQHIRSQKHLQNINANKAFSRATIRRRSTSSKKSSNNNVIYHLGTTNGCLEAADLDNCDTNSNASVEADRDHSLISGAHSL